MEFKTAIANTFKALRTLLTRTGVTIGGTASYPRVEIHSAVEGEPMDKERRIRSILVTIECISDEKLSDAISLTEGNIEIIFGQVGLSVTDFSVIGIVPGQVRMLSEQETLEQNRIIYRLLQDVTVWVEYSPSPTANDTDTQSSNS